MTRIKDVIPRPSHPINKIIRWGIKIRKFIERTNNRTRWMNRFINGSLFIYEAENCIILAEIKRTAEENDSPRGSKMNGV